MDIVKPEIRSKMMASVKSKNTKPERIVRTLLHSRGYRFRLHRKDLPGSPDIVLTKYKTIIFVHGCFWHQHKGCPKSARPSSRVDFWNKKLDETINRDMNNISRLKESGWSVHIIWECQTKDRKKLIEKIKAIFNFTKNI